MQIYYQASTAQSEAPSTLPLWHREQPLPRRHIWAHSSFPQDTSSNPEPTERPLEVGRKQSDKVTSLPLPTASSPCSSQVTSGQNQEDAWDRCCWRKEDKKERRARLTSGLLPQQRRLERQDLTKQALLITHKGRKQFLQNTEVHYRLALNLEKKVLSDTEVTAKVKQ